MKGYLGVCLLVSYAADGFQQHLKVIIVLLRSKYGFFLPFYLVFYQHTFLVISSKEAKLHFPHNHQDDVLVN